MSRRQLELEAKRLREHMAQQLGSAENIAQRHEARLHRIRLIEHEMIRLQQKHREQVSTLHACLSTGYDGPIQVLKPKPVSQGHPMSHYIQLIHVHRCNLLQLWLFVDFDCFQISVLGSVHSSSAWGSRPQTVILGEIEHEAKKVQYFGS